MLTNEQKLMLIDHILADAWEWCIGNEKPKGFYEGILAAIGAVLALGVGD